MIRTWLAGLLRRRRGQLLAAAAGISVAVGLLTCLGAFLTGSQSTMTARALRSVAVAWQVEVQPGGDPRAVLHQVVATPGVAAALPVHFAPASGFSATTGGAIQTTGAGVVLGLPASYRTTFPDQVRTLTGADSGALLGQQTAANLHVRPGDQIQVTQDGRPPITVRIDGVVDLPQADTLFQRIGAPPQSQPSAPPDNVLLLPDRHFGRLIAPARVTTQIHVAHRPPADPRPAAAYQTITAEAHNLEARLAGAGVVGNNMGAVLDAARGDAAYAHLIFGFLGVPGLALAAMITAAVVAAGGERRQVEQALLRTRGLSPRMIIGLAGSEAVAVGLLGGLLGLLLAAVLDRYVLGTDPAGSANHLSVGWSVLAAATGLGIALAVVLVPAVLDLRRTRVSAARRRFGASRTPWWQRVGVDLVLLAGALAVFVAFSGNGYSLVLAPEGVASISVSYWAVLGPALLWIGAALLLWRLIRLALTHGRRPLTAILRVATGRLAGPGAASLTRQPRTLARAVVLLAVAVSFAASTAVFNATYRQQAEADAQLTNGADVTVVVPPGNPAGQTLSQHLSSVPGVRRIEQLQHRFAYVGSDLQDLYGVRPDTIGQVTSLQDGYFTGATAAQLMTVLASRPDSVLVSAETVKDFQLQPGDLLNLRLRDAVTGQLKVVPFHYAGIVNEFPTAPRDSFFVANASYVAARTGSSEIGTLLIDTGGRNQPQVAAAVRNELGAAGTVTDLTQTRSQVGSSLTSVDLSGLTRIELLFAALLAMAAGGLVMFLGQADRRRSLALMSVLGARRRQLSRLVLIESGLVALAGLIGGGLIAWALSAMLIKLLTGVFDPPPSTIPIPTVYLGSTLAAVLVGLAAAAIITAARATRPAVEDLREL